MLVSVPSGKGKSRIIAAIIALQADFKAVNNFTIVYSNEILKSANEKKYKNLATILNKSIEQVVFEAGVTLQSKVDRGSYVLIDEADFILLD